jgi:glycosyltransferase involved in cell wall biosynthesis
MHIIVLENEPSSLRGGQELSLLDVCRGLSQRGHDITLLYLKEGDLLKQYHEFCKHVIKVNSYRIERGGKRKRIISSLKFLGDIWKIPKTKNSLVYTNSYISCFFGYTLALSKNLHLVCHLRLPPPSARWTNDLTPYLNRRHIKDLLWPTGQWVFGMKSVNQFITISNQTKCAWTELGFKKEKFNVVYNGINPEIFKPSEKFFINKQKWNIPEDTTVISYVGRLDKQKGLETLIRSFALLLKIRINTRLLIAGKPIAHSSPEEGEKYQKSLEQLLADLGIEKYVDFLGHVTDTTSLYQVSDVTVLPSIWAEPFGRTIIESMACETPVVASRIGGIPEILTGEFQSGLFEPENERDLTDTINSIIDWRHKNPELGKRCREHILSKFTLDRMLEGVEKVLLSCVKY